MNKETMPLDEFKGNEYDDRLKILEAHAKKLHNELERAKRNQYISECQKHIVKYAFTSHAWSALERLKEK